MLSIPSVKTLLSVNTITGHETFSSSVVSGLSVKGLYGYFSEWVNLPATYSKNNIDIDTSEMATAESVNRWPYLKEISCEFGKRDESSKVGLIIGASCPKALEPHKIIRRQSEDGPYAFLTKLGWCVVGPKGSTNSSSSLSCHRIATTFSNSTFMNKNQIEESSIEEMMKQLYEIEHVNILPDHIPDKVSQEDIKFLNIMNKESKKVNGHYILPLPFKDNIKLPNNKAIALNRLNSLKRKFLKNPGFHSEYVEFMNSILSKNYASKVETETSESWYLPHQRVHYV